MSLIPAHLGLVCLYFGDLQRATGAGRWLARLLTIQPDLSTGLLLRRDRSGHLVEDFPADQAAFHVVRTQEPDQAYFMIGYPLHSWANCSTPQPTTDTCRQHTATLSSRCRAKATCGPVRPATRWPGEPQSSAASPATPAAWSCRWPLRIIWSISRTDRRLAHRPANPYHVRPDRRNRYLAAAGDLRRAEPQCANA
jgi:hypothetical protein